MIRVCDWCAIRLRWWQRTHCPPCRRALGADAGIYLRGGGPPFPYGSRRGER